MIQITNFLYQGNRSDVADRVWENENIRSIIRVSTPDKKEAVFNPKLGDFSYLWCPFDDDGKSLTFHKLHTIWNFYSASESPILVHCSAGQNRSTLICAWLLSKLFSSVPGAISLVVDKCPHRKVFPTLIAKMKEITDWDFSELL